MAFFTWSGGKGLWGGKPKPDLWFAFFAQILEDDEGDVIELGCFTGVVADGVGDSLENGIGGAGMVRGRDQVQPLHAKLIIYLVDGLGNTIGVKDDGVLRPQLRL